MRARERAAPGNAMLPWTRTVSAVATDTVSKRKRQRSTACGWWDVTATTALAAALDPDGRPSPGEPDPDGEEEGDPGGEGDGLSGEEDGGVPGGSGMAAQ